jgi:hypothetical protein
MRVFTLIPALTAVFVLTLSGCDEGTTDPANTASEDDRGHVGKADLVGSCEGACGGPSGGNCWCDDLCEDFGDCCDDKATVCDPPATCAGDNPVGCVETGCGDGEVCSTQTDACVPSACSCDEATGSWLCTADCGGGECVPGEPDPDPAACAGDNPAGCVTTGCAADEVCSTQTDACIASACSCDETTGTWLCTADCGGGECVPAEPGSACQGSDPSQMCIEDGGCIPSACSCDEVTGTWLCTPDCNGGIDC